MRKIIMLCMFFFIILSCRKNTQQVKESDHQTDTKQIITPDNKNGDAIDGSDLVHNKEIVIPNNQFVNIPDNKNVVALDESNLVNNKKFDFGIFLNGTEELYDNAIKESQDYMTIVEKEFTHPVSGYKIYYTGPMEKSEGEYWIYHNKKKQVILKTHFRYGPAIIWYGDYIAGIDVSSANFGGAFFYDLKNNILSDYYAFLLYVDEDYNNIIVIEDGCLSMYNFHTNMLIEEFEFGELLIEYFDKEIGEKVNFHRRPHQNQIYVNGSFEIEKPDKDTLVIKYEVEELRGEFIYRY